MDQTITMKLLLCKICEDIVKLDLTTRTCHCGATGGHYKEDKLNAVYYGPAVPVGFSNPEFRKALREQPEYGNGINFTAFVIPKVCPTMAGTNLDYYTPVDNGIVVEELYDDMQERALIESKRRKLKNVFKDEE